MSQMRRLRIAMKFEIFPEHAQQMFFQPHHQGMHPAIKNDIRAFKSHLRGVTRREILNMNRGGNHRTANPQPLGNMALHLGPQNHFRLQRFDGSFDALRGLPTFSLTGNITATSFTTAPFTQSLYQSQLSFLMSAVTPTYAPQVLTLGHESQTAGGVTTDTPYYAGATQVAVNSAAASLDAIVRLSFDVMPGQAYNINSFVNGLVTAEPGSQQTSTHGELLSSAGVIDFSHTAQLALYVPQGVTVVGDPLVNQIVVTAVPEPQAASMLLAGLLALAGIARRRTARR